MSEVMLRFSKVSVVFGDAPERALSLLDAGGLREEVQAQTGQTLGVHDCSLEISKGEIVVLMGLSGSGKSTLLRAANGLNPIVRGQIEVAGEQGLVDLTALSPRRLQHLRNKNISMVFQQFALFPWRSVAENVGFGLEIAGIPASQRAARIAEQLALVGLAQWADHPVGALSGGMQQRVGLARALATQAPILLMDEPFSALDPLIRSRLQDELLELQNQLGRTILFVSHDLDEAMKLGNRIAILEGGRIVQVASGQEIVQRPATSHVAEFVAHMNPLAVLRAREVMCAPPSHVPEGAREVAADARIGEILRLLADEDSPLIVRDGARAVGQINREAALRALQS